jgi:hypothetical protein
MNLFVSVALHMAVRPHAPCVCEWQAVVDVKAVTGDHGQYARTYSPERIPHPSLDSVGLVFGPESGVGPDNAVA